MKFWDGMTDKTEINKTDFLMFSDEDTDEPQRGSVEQLFDFKNGLDETITGQKTFDKSPKVPEPAEDEDSVNKKTLDSKTGYTLTSNGDVYFNKINGKLTLQNSLFITFKNRIGVIYGGTSEDAVLDFQVATKGTGINLIYVDVPKVGDIGSIQLKSSSFVNMPDENPDKLRLIIGSGYYYEYNNRYYLTILGLIDSTYNLINKNTLDINVIKGINIIAGNNSDMSGTTEWIDGLGSLNFDVNSTVSGKMFLGFSAGNQAITLINKLIIGNKYQVFVKAKLHSGTGGMPIRLGSMFETPLNNNVIEFIPTTSELTFSGEIIADSENIWIGCISAENNGSNFEIDDIIFYDLTSLSLISIDERLKSLEFQSKTKIKIFNTAQFLASLSRYDKPLTKIAIEGDSLMANATGGAIPVEFDEGETRRPIRLVTNQIARRIYDLISWNKPKHRRLDDSDFTKSGTWVEVNSGIFEGAQDKYHSSTTANSYAEIIIPNGYENFAIVCRKNDGYGKLNVIINNGDPISGNTSDYGSAQIDLNRTSQGSLDVGNPFYTEIYVGLQSGNNMLRISKEDNSDEVQIWGIFYWSGNTVVVNNIAHGGHTLQDLVNQHIQAELIENDFDAILFELPLMNEAGCGSVASTSSVLEDIIEMINGKDVAFISCHPFGISPLDVNVNYWEIYNSPSMLDYNDELRDILFYRGLPFIDVFSIFKNKIENRGGTLETGEGGLWYTWDGQHQSEIGMREFWNIIRFVFENKPIRF